MIITPKWESRFQLDNGTWVFVPNSEMRLYGRELKNRIESLWAPPINYFHLRLGGHVLALRQHLNNHYFARADIQNFFGQINKSRLSRNLKSYLPYTEARDIAVNSTVVFPESSPKRYILPYGFVQSPILAALCLDKSALGTAINTISSDVTITVYVDDLVLSGTNEQKVADALEYLKNKGVTAKFSFNPSKLEGPATKVTSFNIELSHHKLEIAEYRMQRFKTALEGELSEPQIEGILGYVKSVNFSQFRELLDYVKSIESE